MSFYVEGLSKRFGEKTLFQAPPFEAAALLREKCAGRPTLLATHDQQAIQALGWPVLELAKLCD